jgi:SAM-dependent methyltransferase
MERQSKIQNPESKIASVVHPDPMHPSTLRYLSCPTIAEEYDDYWADNPLFTYDTRLLSEWFDRPGRMLDIGCGTARHVIHFAQRGHRVVGVDLSAHMIRVAGEKIRQAGVAASLVQADITDLPTLFEADAFDYALCMFSTIGLVAGRDNRKALVAGIARLLRPGGRFAIHVHNRWHGLFTTDGLYFLASNLWQSWRGQAQFGDKTLWYYRGIRNMYVHIFSRGELVDLLNGAGLVIREIVPLNRCRSGPLKLRIASSVRANGFIAMAEKTGLGSLPRL